MMDEHHWHSLWVVWWTRALQNSAIIYFSADMQYGPYFAKNESIFPFAWISTMKTLYSQKYKKQRTLIYESLDQMCHFCIKLLYTQDHKIEVT